MTKLREKIVSILKTDSLAAIEGCDTSVCEDNADAIMAMIKPKDLVWEFEPNCDYELKAITAIGTYFICDDTDDFTGFFVDLVSCKNAKWYGAAVVYSEEVAAYIHDGFDAAIAKAKAYAQEHYNQMLPDMKDVE